MRYLELLAKKITCAAVCLPLLVCGGCSLQQRTAPLPTTFLEDVDISEELETVPFQHAQIVPDDDSPKTYSSVFVQPIRTDLIPKDSWRQSSSLFLRTEDAYNLEVQGLADFFYQQILDELQKVPNKRFNVVSIPTDTTIVAEIALTDVEFSHPVTRAAALAAPLPGVDLALSAFTDPHLSFAVRFTDGKTRKLLASAADRRFPPFRIIDLNKLTITSSAREIVKMWARELAEAIQTDRLTKVERSSWFSILPW
jgi:hypothetical protein